MGDLAKLIEDTIHDELLELHGPADIAEAVLAAIREHHVIVARVAPADLPKHLAEEIEGDLASLCLDEWLDDSAINALRGRMLGRVLAARSAALEEAAKAVDAYADDCCGDYEKSGALTAAGIIRALIGGQR